MRNLSPSRAVYRALGLAYRRAPPLGPPGPGGDQRRPQGHLQIDPAGRVPGLRRVWSTPAPGSGARRPRDRHTAPGPAPPPAADSAPRGPGRAHARSAAPTRRVLAGPAPERRLRRAPRRRCSARAAQRHPVVDYLLVQHMAKLIASHHCPIRPLPSPSRRHELALARTRAAHHASTCPTSAAEARSHGRHRQLAPPHWPPPAAVALGTEPSNCCSMSCRRLSGTAVRAPQAPRDAHLALRHECTRPGAQGVHQLHQKQRVAVRAPVPPSHHGSGAPPPRQARRHIPPPRPPAATSGPLPAQPVQGQLLLDRLQGMPMHDHLHRPIRAQHQQPRRLAPPRQIRQQVQRGLITPVQVFEHQHQRAARPSAPRRLRPLPQHALPRRPQHLALQRLRSAWLQEAGICSSHVGACCSSSASTSAASGPRQSRPSASSTGR